MTPEQIGETYDTITERWSDEWFDLSNGIAQHQRALAFVTSKGKALDVGCGRTGRLMELLAREGFQPEGVDISRNMITLAKSRNPEWNFYHDDIGTLVLPEKYDFITAWDSIWHIHLDEQVSVMSKIANALNPNGILIFSFGGSIEPSQHTDHTMGPSLYYSSLGIQGYIQVLMDNACTIKHLEFDQQPELHAYIVAQKNFQNIEPLVAESKRSVKFNRVV